MKKIFYALFLLFNSGIYAQITTPVVIDGVLQKETLSSSFFVKVGAYYKL